MVVARTADGEIGVLPDHAPLLATLTPGFVVRIVREAEPELVVAVHGGFLSVHKDGVSVLAEQAEIAADIYVARARDQLNRYDADGDADEVAARNRALARLRAAGEQV